jgi:hypothetical protein
MYGDYGSGLNMKVGRERIGQIAGLSPRSVTTQMAILQKAGLLKWDGIHTVNGRARNYALTIPDERKRIEKLPEAHTSAHLGTPVAQEKTLTPAKEREQTTTEAGANSDTSASTQLPPICSIQGTEQRVVLAAPLEAPQRAASPARQERTEGSPWPENESKEPAVATTSGLNTLTGAWPKVLEELKATSTVSWAIWCSSRPTALTGDTITVSLGDPNKVTYVVGTKYETALVDALTAVIKVPVRVLVAA